MTKKILIIDDNEKNIKLMRFLLQQNGFESLEAGDAREGIGLAMEYVPALILMDIHMPSLDGIQALRMLKDEKLTSMIPVIAVTSYAMKGDMEKFISEGFDDYVAKPIDSGELIRKVKKYL